MIALRSCSRVFDLISFVCSVRVFVYVYVSVSPPHQAQVQCPRAPLEIYGHSVWAGVGGEGVWF